MNNALTVFTTDSDEPAYLLIYSSVVQYCLRTRYTLTIVERKHWVDWQRIKDGYSPVTVILVLKLDRIVSFILVEFEFDPKRFDTLYPARRVHNLSVLLLCAPGPCPQGYSSPSAVSAGIQLCL